MGGWTAEQKSGGVRLLSRNVPVTDSHFLDLHHHPVTDCVVGILSKPSGGSRVSQGQVLVDEEGKPTGNNKTRIISVNTYKSEGASTGSSGTNAASTGGAAATASDEQNKQMLQYGLCAFGALIVFQILSQAMFALSLLFVPVLYFYALQTCPHETSFDAKRELRRVMRGEQLPDNHPDKPKGWLDETIARVNARITTELATGLGYEVTMMSVAGAAWFTTVRVPTSGMDFYWIGAFDRWIYVYATKYDTETTAQR